MSLARDLAWQNLELVHQASISHQFARYALGLSYESLPPEVVQMAKRILLDTLTCAIGASEAPGRPMIEDVIKEIGGAPESTIFGSGLKTSAINATLINSFMVRYLDTNDMGGGGHNNEAVPSILAVAEKMKASGKDFLTSLVISYELGFRVAESVIGPNFEARGWNIDCRVGLSQPAALGRLLGLNEEQIANAIGLAGAHAPSLGILDCHREEMAMGKDMRFAFAAQHAIECCQLAKHGVTGFVRVVEGDKGFAQVLLNREMDLEKLVDFSGWRILNTSFKTICMNWTTNAHILASLALVKEHDIKPEEVARVRIRTSPRDAAHVTTFSRKYPKNAESATHSAYFGNAIVIKERALGPEQLREEKFTDPVVLDLIEKMTVEADHSFPERGPGGISEIWTKDGRHLEKRLEVPHGHISDPMSQAEIEDKFRRYAGIFIAPDKVRKLIDMARNVEKLGSVGELTRELVW